MQYQEIGCQDTKSTSLRAAILRLEEPKHENSVALAPAKSNSNTSQASGEGVILKRYTLEDLEKPVVTAEGALLDTEEGALFNILSDIGEIKNKHLYPLFSFYLRQFQESISDYRRDPDINACEIDFWRGTMGYIYGERLCIISSLMFGLELTVDRLRRLAERKMGLPKGTLTPVETDPLRQEERASHVQQVFNDIVRDHGHLADPEADSFFVIQRRKSRCFRK